MIQIPVDTSAEADRVQHVLWSRMSVDERMSRALALSRELLELSRGLIDRDNPQATPEDRLVLYIRSQYGALLAEGVRDSLETSRKDQAE